MRIITHLPLNLLIWKLGSPQEACAVALRESGKQESHRRAMLPPLPTTRSRGTSPERDPTTLSRPDSCVQSHPYRSFVNPLSRFFLGTYCVPGTVLGVQTLQQGSLSPESRSGLVEGMKQACLPTCFESYENKAHRLSAAI